jgi:predicted O-methyltransferase YrrM
MESIIINHFSRRRELIQMLRERGSKFGVEIGTDHGQYAQQLCEGIPGLKLCCVDPWLAYTEGEEVHSQQEMDLIYLQALERLNPYGCIIERSTSIEVAKRVTDNTIDFVFIDGNHEYDYVLQDITEWTKKVKFGGIVCGHDYKEDKLRKYGVIEAVQKYTKDNHIAPWFVLHAGGSLVDCWMFIKQP